MIRDLQRAIQFGDCFRYVMSALFFMPTTTVQAIDLFHNNFSPSGKQPEHRKLAHEL